jgi:hypothetical protein
MLQESRPRERPVFFRPKKMRRMKCGGAFRPRRGGRYHPAFPFERSPCP